MRSESDLAALAANVDISCYVKIWDTSLRDLDAVHGLRRAHSWFSVMENSDLSDISMLGSIDQLLGLKLRANPSLAVVDMDLTVGAVAIEVLDSPIERLSWRLDESMDQLVFNDLPELRELAVTGLRSVLGIRLQHLRRLPNLSGLSDLRSAPSVKLKDLPLITQAQADAFLAQLTTPPDEVVVCGLADTDACP